MTLQDAGKGLWRFITPGSLSDTLARKGYVVLLVARRGYRGSEGTTTTYSTNLTSRMEGKSAAEVMRGAGLEADDVIAALEYLLALPYVDKERVAVGGVSLGGLVSVMAVAGELRVKALVAWRGDTGIADGAGPTRPGPSWKPRGSGRRRRSPSRPSFSGRRTTRGSPWKLARRSRRPSRMPAGPCR